MFEIKKIANGIYALFDVVLGMTIDTGSKRSMEYLARIIEGDETTNDRFGLVDREFDE